MQHLEGLARPADASCFLQGCAKGSRPDLADTWWKEMKQRGVAAAIEDYEALIRVTTLVITEHQLY